MFLSGKWHGQRSLEGYSPWGCKESDMTEHMSTHTHSVRKGIVPPNNSLHGVKIYGIRKLYQTYTHFGKSLVVQWLELGDFTAKGLGSIPSWVTKIRKVSVSHSVVPDSLWPSGLQHTRLLCPQSMRFSRQGYWSGLPFPSPGVKPSGTAKNKQANKQKFHSL